jgi:hypothetical protein
MPRWKMLITQPSATMGQLSMPRYTVNATNWPSVMRPAITSRPPTQIASTAPTPLQNASEGWNTPEMRISPRWPWR